MYISKDIIVPPYFFTGTVKCKCMYAHIFASSYIYLRLSTSIYIYLQIIYIYNYINLTMIKDLLALTNFNHDSWSSASSDLRRSPKTKPPKNGDSTPVFCEFPDLKGI